MAFRLPFVTRSHFDDVVRLKDERIAELKQQLEDMAECVVEKGAADRQAIERHNAVVEARNAGSVIDTRPKEKEDPQLPFDHSTLRRPGRFTKMVSGSRARDYNSGTLRNRATQLFDAAVREGRAAAEQARAVKEAQTN